MYVVGAIIGLAILLLVLLVPPVSILSRGGDASGASTGPGDSRRYHSTVHSGVPKLPPGLVAESAMFDLSAPVDKRGPSRLTIPLKAKENDGSALALYTFKGNAWERLSDATLTTAGAAATGDVTRLPGNIAVLRRSKALTQIAGSAPAGTTIDPRAADVITTLHPLVFIPTQTGSLAGQPPAVPPAAYKLVPGVVSPYPEVVDTLLRSPELRAAHAGQIADAVKQGNFAGIDVDYRFVNAALRDEFSDFVAQLQSALHRDGRTLTLTLPLQSGSNGERADTAYDWERLGSLADTIELAGELDQELYFLTVESSLRYVTERVDPNKLMLMLTSRSVERSSEGVRAMSLVDALTIAADARPKDERPIVASQPVELEAPNLAPSEGASGLRWDDNARSVTFSYAGLGGKRTAWITNEFSAGFRIELARRFGLGGVSVDDVSLESGGADVWGALRRFADGAELGLAKPNGDLLTPSWTSSAGSFSAPVGDSVSWVPPAEAGPQTITLVVSDGITRIGRRITVQVSPPAAPPAAQ